MVRPAAPPRALDALGHVTYSGAMALALSRPGDRVTHDPAAPVVLVGGYGTVGRELALLLREHWPELPLTLMGRRPQAGAALARELGAEVAQLDLGSPSALTLRARAVITLVNDAEDRVLRACLESGTPFVDITRWTARVARAAALAAAAGTRAPVVLASGWMGGIVPWVAGTLAREAGGSDAIEVGILYDLADRAGEDAIEYMDRMGIPFEITRDGQTRTVVPLTEPARLLEGGRSHTLLRIDTPEQWTLPLTLAVRTAETRIGFSSELATWGLRALRWSGFFCWARGPRLRGLRRALLRSSGAGGRALVRVRAARAERSAELTLVDARGQARLTALGALRALERALGLDGQPPPAGAAFPELWPGDAARWLRERGVDVRAAGS